LSNLEPPFPSPQSSKRTNGDNADLIQVVNDSDLNVDEEHFTDDSSDSDDAQDHHHAREDFLQESLPNLPAYEEKSPDIDVSELPASPPAAADGDFQSQMEELIALFPMPPACTTRSFIARPSWALTNMGVSGGLDSSAASFNDAEDTWTRDTVVVEDVEPLHKALYDALYEFSHKDAQMDYPEAKDTSGSANTGAMIVGGDKPETPDATKIKVGNLWLAVHRTLFNNEEVEYDDLAGQPVVLNQAYVDIQTEFEHICQKLFDAQGAASQPSNKLSRFMKKSTKMGIGLLQKAMDGASPSDGGTVHSYQADLRSSSALINFNQDVEDENDGQEMLPCKMKLFRRIKLTNYGEKKATFNLHILRPPEDDHGWYDITVRPTNGVLKTNESADVDITMSVLHGKCNFHPVLAIHVEGAPRRFVLMHGTSEPSVFGVEAEDLGQTPVDLVVEGQVVAAGIPNVLALLHKRFVDKNGVDQVGIFRLAPDEWDVHAARSQLNRGDLQDRIDVVCIANMIKIWFRELPHRLLSSLPDEHVMNCDTEEDAVKCTNMLSEYQVVLSPSSPSPASSPLPPLTVIVVPHSFRCPLPSHS
jgi:hypothetical protein